MKEKVLSDDGRKQQDKLRELAILAATFDCTLAQLAIGKYERGERPRLFFILINASLSRLAWCLKNDNVHCILLGASSVEQLYENLQSLHVNESSENRTTATCIVSFFPSTKVATKLTPSIMADIDRILGNKPSMRVVTKNETIHAPHQQQNER